MYVRAFDWDSWNVEHIARHGLQPHDVEIACRGQTLVLRGRQGHYLVYGRTGAGRYLLVVLHMLSGGRTRVITARDMNERERRLYHRRR